MIAIVDYGVGNLFSLKSSLRFVGADVTVTGDERELCRAEKIILPGVGAFGDAAEKLRRTGLGGVVQDEAWRGKPLLGICLGMQLLFEKSLEFGEHEGLGLVPGTVQPLSEVLPSSYKIPQIGWNALRLTMPQSPIFKYTRDGECVYFVHSYHAVDCGSCLAATVEYGADVTAAVARENVYGCQFHPEKSGEVGLNILRAFCEL